MSVGVVAGGMLLSLFIGYRLYGRLVERKCVEPDGDAPTPAHALRDDVDFVPARPITLFGHHFSSIAGAGPIIGPILGVAWFGWAATLGWILLGSVFAGGVHDFLSLMVSTRKQGRGMQDVADEVISPRASLVYALFLWLALVLVIAVFGVVGAKAMVSTPSIVFPTFMLIPIAMLLGFLYSRTACPLWLATVVCLGLNFLCIYTGYQWLPLTLAPPESVSLPLDAAAWLRVEANQMKAWFGVLMAYGLIASILPVWLLLQPRDYICVFKLFLGLALGFAAVFLTNQAIGARAWVGAVHAKGGPIWPMLFVLVACGAISGFHSVVASGTTSKQLDSEGQARRIAYGGMIMEGALATLAVCCVGAGLTWGTAVTGALDLHAPTILGPEGGGPLKAFANGFGHLVETMWTWLPAGFASVLGMIILKTFVMTTLDTCTRLARFVVTEKLGPVHPLFAGRAFATVITIVPAAYLGLSGGWKTIWPVFGAANQLIAALALIVISAYLLGVRRPSIYAAVPAVFMLFTTCAALLWQAWGFVTEGNWVLAVVSLVLTALAFYVAAEGVVAVLALARERRAEEARVPIGDG
jgi:carbon starvation protein